MSCLFCKIVENTIPAAIIYRDAEIVAFNDLHPQAPVHVLIIPQQHIPHLNAAQPENCLLLGKMLIVAQKLAQDLNIASPGYRLVLNTNAAAGQTIFHLHLHLLGGRELQWPPG